jgi:hypothetical protein
MCLLTTTNQPTTLLPTLIRPITHHTQSLHSKTTYLLLVPNIPRVVNIPLNPLKNLLLGVRHTHQYATLHLRRNALFDRLFQHRATENDKSRVDIWAGVLEVVPIQTPCQIFMLRFRDNAVDKV